MWFGLVTIAALAAGCAHSETSAAPLGTRTPYAVQSIDVQGLPPTELATSREFTRADSHNVVLARDDTWALRDALARNLDRDLALRPDAAYKLRVTVRVQAPGSFLGLSAETADLSANADVIDANGAVVHTVTVRQSANAPLQRSKSRRDRLEAAVSRLSQKLAAEL
jgi:hypothetical protein